MADVLLIVGSAAVSFLLPAPHSHNLAFSSGGSGGGSHTRSTTTSTSAGSNEAGDAATNSTLAGKAKMVPIDMAPIRVSLALSLFLFALGVIEILPPSWLMLLNNNSRSQHLYHHSHDDLPTDRRIALVSAYRLLLWADSIFIAVLVPAVLGIKLIFRFCFGMSHISGISASSSASDKSAAVSSRDQNNFLFSIIRLVVSLVSVVCRILLRQCKRALPVLGNRQQGLPMVRSSGQVSHITSPRTHNNSSNISISGYKKRTLFLGSALGLVCSFVSLRAFGAIVDQVEDEMENRIALKIVVSQICALGVIISSVLAGFGSVSMPYSCLVGLYLPHINDHAIVASEQNYSNVLRAMDEKRKTLEEMQAQRALVTAPTEISPPASTTRSFSFATGLLRSSPGPNNRTTTQQLSSLKDELEFLQTLSEDLWDEIEEMKLVQTQTRRSRTLVGRATGWVGVVFSVVLLIRVVLALVAVMAPRAAAGDSSSSINRTDPITIFVSFLTGYSIISEDQYSSLCQLSSLLLTAFLSCSQVRTFLNTISVLNRRFGCLWKKCGGSSVGVPKRKEQNRIVFLDPNPGIFLVAAIMGSFFLCCLVLMKLNLPANYRRSFSAALKGFDFAFDLMITNFVFVLSAGISAVVLGMLFGIKRKATNLHDKEMDAYFTTGQNAIIITSSSEV